MESEYTDLEQMMLNTLRHSRTVDIAESDFKHAINDDAELKKLYRSWCHREGYTEKYGFRDFCETYLEDQQEMFDNLENDFD